MGTLFDIDPQIVEAVLTHADDFLGAQSRVEEVIKAAEQKVATAEQELSRQLNASISEETAVDEYTVMSQKIRMETESLLQGLTKEYEVKFPASEATVGV
ncbi:MAG: hypothetical protein Q8R25_00870 [bacterium]|nr:hypothetical protein [bacterium]